MPDIRRADRVARLLQEELSQLIRREVRDPRVQDVTVTRVDLTDDLRSATIWFTPLGGLGDSERIAKLQAGLDKAAAFLQGKAGRNLKLRLTPRLRFRYDAGVDNLVRMHEVFGSLQPDPAPADAVEQEEPDGSAS